MMTELDHVLFTPLILVKNCQIADNLTTTTYESRKVGHWRAMMGFKRDPVALATFEEMLKA